MNKQLLLRRERRLLAPLPDHPWWRSHAQYPTVLTLSDRRWRVYFAARGADNQSRILYADFDPARDFELIRVSEEPLLDLGRPGAFDSAGMGPSATLRVGDRIFLYYVGIALRPDVPYQQAIGLAISDDGGATFRPGVPGTGAGDRPVRPLFHVSPARDPHRRNISNVLCQRLRLGTNTWPARASLPHQMCALDRRHQLGHRRACGPRLRRRLGGSCRAALDHRAQRRIPYVVLQPRPPRRRRLARSSLPPCLCAIRRRHNLAAPGPISEL